MNDGGPAFPHAVSTGWSPKHQGMSLRQWYAGQALKGVLANEQLLQRVADFGIEAYCFARADAMLKERERVP